MTTAGGDGLSFMIGQPNIFELIEALKDGTDLLAKKNQDEAQTSESLATEETEEDQEEEAPQPSKPFTDFDLTSLEDLPAELAPIHTLIELVQHLEKIKETWRPQSEAVAEFLKIVRQIKSTDKIFTCSHTLQLLLDKYKVAFE